MSFSKCVGFTILRVVWMQLLAWRLYLFIYLFRTYFCLWFFLHIGILLYFNKRDSHHYLKKKKKHFVLPLFEDRLNALLRFLWAAGAAEWRIPYQFTHSSISPTLCRRSFTTSHHLCIANSHLSLQLCHFHSFHILFHDRCMKTVVKYCYRH